MHVEPADYWMVMVMEDVREVAEREGLDASAEAISAAIAALKAEAGERRNGTGMRASLESDAGFGRR